MKPAGAITCSMDVALTATSFEDALLRLGCFPICSLRVHPANVHVAQRIIGWMTPNDDGPDTSVAAVVPRINIVIDPSFNDEQEWAVEYDGKVYWNQGV